MGICPLNSGSEAYRFEALFFDFPDNSQNATCVDGNEIPVIEGATDIARGTYHLFLR